MGIVKRRAGRVRSDQELETAARRGDRLALEEILQRHGAAVLALTHSMIGDVPLAREVAEEVFTTLGVDSGAGQGAGALRTRLMQLARAKMLDSLADSGTSAVEMHAKVQPTMRIELPPHLTPHERRLVTMTFFGGLTYKEVASSLGLAENEVLTMLRGAMQHLRPNRAGVGVPLPS